MLSLLAGALTVAVPLNTSSPLSQLLAVISSTTTSGGRFSRTTDLVRIFDPAATGFSTFNSRASGTLPGPGKRSPMIKARTMPFQLWLLVGMPDNADMSSISRAVKVRVSVIDWPTDSSA